VPVGLTPYITPAMLLSSNYGISWSTFPKPGASVPEQVAAQSDICATVTSEMDTLANMTLRATIDTEQEFGPDLIITTLSNGWTRFRLSPWPILQLLSGQVSPAGCNPPQWTTIPASAMITEHAGLPQTGTIVPTSAGPGPTAALIAPGYVSWGNGRKGYLVRLTVINGFPVAGIDTASVVGATSLHVDDITGWWNGTAGARGTIYSSPHREVVVVTDAYPDGGAPGPATNIGGSGPGTLVLSAPLQFAHDPAVGSLTTADQRILLSSMPAALIQAGHYLATHLGLVRGTTSAVMQSARGGLAPGSVKSAADWRALAQTEIARFARVF
jgi:hypothetical protein